MNTKNKASILWFDEISRDDIPLVGGKNANLGEMYQKLTKGGSATFKNERIKVPYGFAVTAEAYRQFIHESGLESSIKRILSDLNTNNIKQLEVKGSEVRQLILGAKFPPALEAEIKEAYAML